MDEIIQLIIQLITNDGFPMAMCFVMGYYIKYTHDDHRSDIERIQKSHSEEMKSITTAVDNNTAILTKLLARIGDDENE